MAAHEGIYEFAASIDTDDKGVVMGVDNVKDGVASWGDNVIGNVGVGGWGVGVKQETCNVGQWYAGQIVSKILLARCSSPYQWDIDRVTSGTCFCLACKPSVHRMA